MRTNLLGINLDSVPKNEAILRINHFFDKKTESLITTTNLEFIILARYDEEFKNIINKKASLNLIDGSGVVWGIGLTKSWKPKTAVLKEVYVTLQWLLSIIFMPISLIFFKKSVEKVSGSDFALDIARFSAKKNKRLFLLGYRLGFDPNAVHNASLKLLTDIYNLKIVGAHSGTDSITEEKEIIEMIKKSAADILMVCFGSPRQEKWLARNLKKTGCKIGIGLGGTFDFISGVQKRSPKIIRDLGFEWLYRLFANPSRFRRQLNTIPKFLFLVLMARLK